MKHVFACLALGALAAPATAQQNCSYGSTYYTGNVGRLRVQACLTNVGREVTGWYWTMQQYSNTYRLEGTNVQNGRFDLNEYTGSSISARIVLVKRVTAREIVWSGTMHNTDGRRIPMTLRRPR